jgi:hypothetical protein
VFDVNKPRARPIEILLVEDNPGDIRLTKEALIEGKVNNRLSVARDGVEALDFCIAVGHSPMHLCRISFYWT